MSSYQHERDLEERIGYSFADKKLLHRALTHGSLGDGRQVADNERMEFLGDRVLGLIVSSLLFADPEHATEGQMARKLNALVRKEACARAARAASLGEALYMSQAEERNGGRDKTSILGDACEALLAALYLDGGLAAAQAFFDRFWADQLDRVGRSDKDPKSALQEWAAKEGRDLPVYELLLRTGPDHEPDFLVAVTIGQQKQEGSGSSKQRAERQAAICMLQALGVSYE